VKVRTARALGEFLMSSKCESMNHALVSKQGHSFAVIALKLSLFDIIIIIIQIIMNTRPLTV
jgi:hypothetical protein